MQKNNTEFEQLIAMLDNSGIPYQVLREGHIKYFDSITGKRVCSIIDRGLLEMMGLISELEPGDGVLEGFTAEKIFCRISHHYHRRPTIFPEYVIIEGDTATFSKDITVICNDLLEENDIIKKLVIPEGITHINTSFRMCKALEEISFPSTLKEVPEYCCSGNNNLKEITFADGIEVIGMGTFTACEKLKKVHIPGSVKRIEYSAFWLCSISELIIDDGVEHIGELAFADNSLRKVVLPKSVKYVAPNAFEVFDDEEPVHICYKDGSTETCCP